MNRDFNQERKDVLDSVHTIFKGLYISTLTGFITDDYLWTETDFHLIDKKHELQIYLTDEKYPEKFDVALMSYIDGDHNKQVSVFTDRTNDLLLSLKAAKEKYLSLQ